MTAGFWTRLTFARRRLRRLAPAEARTLVMEECGIKTTKNPAEMGKLLKSVLK
jgi:hypothetical protein